MTNKKLTPEQQKWEDAQDRRDVFFKKLKADCPILWRDPVEQGWVPRPSTPETWDDVIYECSIKIEQLINDHKDKIPVEERPYVVQVKEKFGGLRFYTNGYHESINEPMNKIIGDAEDKVRRICSKCDSLEAEPRSKFSDHPEQSFGWTYTLCKPCWRKESIRRAGNSTVKELRRWFYETMTIRKAK